MKRSLAHLPTAVLVAAAIALVAGAAPAQALDSCTMGTPCLPQNAAFISTLPNSVNVGFFGNNTGATLFGLNSNSDPMIPNPQNRAGVLGAFTGGFRGSGVHGQAGVSTVDDVAGVFGEDNSLTPGARAAGVRGESTATGSAGIGVLGLQGGSGFGAIGVHAGRRRGGRRGRSGGRAGRARRRLLVWLGCSWATCRCRERSPSRRVPSASTTRSTRRTSTCSTPSSSRRR